MNNLRPAGARPLVRHLTVVVVLKVIALAVLWAVFVNGQRPAVDGQEVSRLFVPTAAAVPAAKGMADAP
jgi:hypothetical protein